MTDRPSTLREVALQAGSLEDFGRLCQDWLHSLRRVSSRPGAAAAISDEPPPLRGRFPQGDVADAWLAAMAELIAQRCGVVTPAWSLSPRRILKHPWFAEERSGPELRLIALRDSPSAFKRRNLYAAAVDLPLRLRAGRPRKSADELRRSNAERQRRFRERRALELELLRTALREA
jgi:hypothetical protein